MKSATHIAVVRKGSIVWHCYLCKDHRKQIKKTRPLKELELKQKHHCELCLQEMK